MTMKYRFISDLDCPLFDKIFENRGVPKEKVSMFYNPKEIKEFSLEKLDYLTEAAKLFQEKISKKVGIIIDSDTDGYTSSAVLINYINDLELEVDLTIFIHPGKEHGITQNIIERVQELGIDFLIVPDAGSGQLEEHKVLSESGVSILVLDHHEAKERSPYATVVNPQLDDYPNKELSGVGIVYKFISLLDKIYKVEFSKKYLDLVALGMIADMVDTRSPETKKLINQGLENIRNPFLKAMLEKQSFSTRGKINQTTIGFYIAPLINAVIRVGTQEEKEILFKSLISKIAIERIPSSKRGAKKDATEMLLELGLRVCTNIKNRQTKIRDSEFQKAIEQISEKNLNDNKIIALIAEEENKNLSGLIANKLVSQYKKPVLMLRENSTQDTFSGSARGYEKSELKDFKDFISSSGLAEYAEGHSSAFGVSFKKENLDKFLQYSNEKLKDIDFDPVYLLDYSFDYLDLDKSDIFEIANMESFWGKGFEEPLFLVKGIKVYSKNTNLLLPSKTLKIETKDITLIKFGSSQEEYESLLSEGFVEIDVIGKFSSNEWNGEVSAQVQIVDFSIKRKQQYYF